MKLLSADWTSRTGPHGLASYNYICYAYSDSFVKSIANMSYLVLKYGSLEEAFRQSTQYKRQ